MPQRQLGRKLGGPDSNQSPYLWGPPQKDFLVGGDWMSHDMLQWRD